MTPGARDEPRFAVVTNADGHYSLWPAGERPPDGWSPEGTEGSRDECLRHIGQAWVDMRPAHLRGG